MKFLIRLFLLILVASGVAIYFYFNGVYSEGTRAGVVIKVSTRGTIFKTMEGQLNMMSFGAVKSSNAMAEVFEFSVEPGDSLIYKELQEVSLTGERVNLHFKERYGVLPWRGETPYFITKIDRLEVIQPYEQRDVYRN